MSNAELAVRSLPGNSNHHLPPTPAPSGGSPAWHARNGLEKPCIQPATAHGATAWPDGEDSAQVAIRIHADSPNHHLWNNNGTWWCHYTLHMRDFTKWRVRTSLATHDLAEARRLRDALLNAANRNGRV